MIILPDRNEPRSKFLLPLHKNEWRTPSLSQPKDQVGNENKTRFKIEAKLNDGHIVWEGWFDDREDFDAFLWGIASEKLKYEKELWSLPTPNWCPTLGEDLQYSFRTYSYFGSPVNTLLTYTKPKDFNTSNNRITCLGGAGSGAAYFRDSGTLRRVATGGGGGGCGQFANFNLTDSSTNYYIGAGGPGGTDGNSDNPGFAGQAGGASFFGGTSYDNSPVGGGGGGGGTFGNNATRLGGAGGVAKGTTARSGGRGGDVTYNSGSNLHGTGGGGAAGWEANGNNGVDITTNVAGTNGGAGNGGLNGGGLPNSGTGTNFGSGIGSGAGGVSGSPGTNGGVYGGASGGALRGAAAAVSGSGIQGLVIVDYEPRLGILFNSPLLGL